MQTQLLNGGHHVVTSTISGSFQIPTLNTAAIYTLTYGVAAKSIYVHIYKLITTIISTINVFKTWCSTQVKLL